jgi:hypothetical protein
VQAADIPESLRFLQLKSCLSLPNLGICSCSGVTLASTCSLCYILVSSRPTCITYRVCSLRRCGLLFGGEGTCFCISPFVRSRRKLDNLAIFSFYVRIHFARRRTAFCALLPNEKQSNIRCIYLLIMFRKTRVPWSRLDVESLSYLGLDSPWLLCDSLAAHSISGHSNRIGPFLPSGGTLRHCKITNNLQQPLTTTNRCVVQTCHHSNNKAAPPDKATPATRAEHAGRTARDFQYRGPGHQTSVCLQSFKPPAAYQYILLVTYDDQLTSRLSGRRIVR